MFLSILKIKYFSTRIFFLKTLLMDSKVNIFHHLITYKCRCCYCLYDGQLCTRGCSFGGFITHYLPLRTTSKKNFLKEISQHLLKYNQNSKQTKVISEKIDQRARLGSGPAPQLHQLREVTKEYCVKNI